MATLSFLTGCAAALNNILHLSRGLNGGNFLSGRNLLTARGMNITSLPLLLLQLPNLQTILVSTGKSILLLLFSNSFCWVCKAISSHGVVSAQKPGKCLKSVYISLDGGCAI